ncbi:MAG TPA: hypothetical protein VM070_06790, partial [Candidatus Saccharimonadales bacterium]|nr:hypothetical protein [Candidatus Saccharimonadales bacterium]
FLFIELFAPILEALGIGAVAVGLVLGVIDVPFAMLIFLLSYGYGLLLTLAAVLLEELAYRRYSRISERIWLIGLALLEVFGYRQLTVIWRLSGLAGFLRKRRDWGVMDRQGFASAQPSSGGH